MTKTKGWMLDSQRIQSPNGKSRLISLLLVAVVFGCSQPGGSGGGGGTPPASPPASPPATYTVMYNANGATGNVPTDSNTYQQGATVTVLGAGSLTWTGYNFAGWTTSTTGPGASYAAGATFTMGTANVTLYCVWIPNTLTFSSSGTNITITGWSGTAPTGSLTIPGGVTGIGGAAFENCTALTGVNFPSSVTSIADSSAFGGCTGLTSVTFTIPSSVTYIGYSTFNECSSLTSVTIPVSVTILDTQAFQSCTSLSSVTFTTPSNVTSLGQGAFEDCTSLPSITIPSSVTSIGLYEFMSCNNLLSVKVNATTPPSLPASSGAFPSSCTAIKVPPASVAAYKSATGWGQYASIIVSQ